MAVNDKTDDFKLLQEVHQTVLEALTKLLSEDRDRVFQSIATLLDISSQPRAISRARPQLYTDTLGSVEGDFSAKRTRDPDSPKQFLLEKQPKTTLSNYRSPRLYKRKKDLDRYLNLLRKAGMPE